MSERPWYRQFWVWFIMVPPLAAVFGGILTILIAVNTADGLVVDPALTQEPGGPSVSSTGKAVWSAD